MSSNVATAAKHPACAVGRDLTLGAAGILKAKWRFHESSKKLFHSKVTVRWSGAGQDEHDARERRERRRG
jgi:hypothetical protein